MPLELDQNSAKYQLQAYKPGVIVVSGQTMTNSIIVSANQLINPWQPTSPLEITLESLLAAAALKPDVLLIGTGGQHVILSLEVYGELINRHIGVEVMNTSAACRTFNALCAENRNVVAALIV